jgi:hypothetical protein
MAISKPQPFWKGWYALVVITVVGASAYGFYNTQQQREQERLVQLASQLHNVDRASKPADLRSYILNNTSELADEFARQLQLGIDYNKSSASDIGNTCDCLAVQICDTLDQAVIQVANSTQNLTQYNSDGSVNAEATQKCENAKKVSDQCIQNAKNSRGNTPGCVQAAEELSSCSYSHQITTNFSEMKQGLGLLGKARLGETTYANACGGSFDRQVCLSTITCKDPATGKIHTHTPKIIR